MLLTGKIKRKTQSHFDSTQQTITCLLSDANPMHVWFHPRQGKGRQGKARQGRQGIGAGAGDGDGGNKMAASLGGVLALKEDIALCHT